MATTTDNLHLIATATFGLEAVVARELRDLGIEATIPSTGRVHFQGDAVTLARANLNLRTADRVVLRLGEFEAVDFGQLYDRTADLPWEDWIPADGAFPVNGRSVKSQLSSVPACQRIVKKAIVDRLMQAHGVDALPETGASYVAEVALLENTATLTLDTTGDGLSKRGYRPLTGKAPLRETLAAALVLLSFWRPERQLVDPFCGTGTIPIEAAMIGRRIAPGMQRTFAAEAWEAIPAAAWQQARDEAKSAELGELPVRILGYDIDTEALSQARYHAKRAGVADDIHFQQRDFLELSSQGEYGVTISNPPYGERLADEEEARRVHRAMPEVFRRLDTWSHYVLTAWPGFETLIGQPADRRRKLFNGRIECTYFQFHGPRPPKLREGRPDEKVKTAPAFGGLSDKSKEQADMFANRLAKRWRHLRRWPTRRGTDCYRLYDRDIPEVPLAVDRYGDFIHVAEYERPHDRPAAEHTVWLETMCERAAEVAGVDPSHVFLKRREPQKGLEQYEKFSDAGRTVIVNENGLRFEVNLSDYLDTGLFLDHRPTREMVRDEAEGKRFLNLFAYTGSFTVYAAAGGAASTVSVDLSKTYLQWAGRNLQFNGLADGNHERVRADVLAWLTEQPPGPRFDLAVVDPPTFSNSKMADEDFEVQRHHGQLIAGVAALMAPDGIIYFSTNFRRFKLDPTALPKLAACEDITERTIDEDFRNQRIHRCWRMVCGG